MAETTAPLAPPAELPNPNYSAVKALCVEYLKLRQSPEYCSDDGSDFEHYLFEEALKAVYGPNVFDYINALPNG